MNTSGGGDAMDNGMRPERFDGTVRIGFHDAVIASTTAALIMRGKDQPIYFVPLKDIYFEHLAKTSTVSNHDQFGRATHYRVSAAGEAADEAMIVFEAPPAPFADLSGYGIFDGAKVGVEAVAEQGQRHTPHILS